jgi:hypothetical protein
VLSYFCGWLRKKLDLSPKSVILGIFFVIELCELLFYRHIYKRGQSNMLSATTWEIRMTEQPNEKNQTVPEKLLIDDPSNFQFHAAYGVYEETFDKTSDGETKEELNQFILDLKENKMSFETFYRDVAPFRKIDVPRQERFTMQTQRKKDWRKKTQRQDRIKRHKK